jgi:hypothetical protein
VPAALACRSDWPDASGLSTVGPSEVMDTQPTTSTVWIWAILGGVVIARAWAIRSRAAWPLTIGLAICLADLWVGITDRSAGRPVQAEARAEYFWTVGLATAVALGLPFLGLLIRRLSDARHQAGFRSVQDLLLKHHLSISEASYQRRSFGSWFVQVTTRPPLRIVWDGKEGWLILQEETEQVFRDMRVWKTLWEARSQTQQTAKEAVDSLLSRIGAA